jgi:hypothetical protein
MLSHSHKEQIYDIFCDDRAKSIEGMIATMKATDTITKVS